MRDTSHLVALQERLSRERMRLAEVMSDEEKALRQVWVVQAERELEAELKFLGMAGDGNVDDMGDDELLSELEVLPP